MLKKITLSARSKLNSIEKIISKALIDFDSSHDEFALVINDGQHYSAAKEASEQKMIKQLTFNEMDRTQQKIRQNERQSLTQ